MPNSKQRIAKTKTINEMYKDGSLPKELENRVTLRKGK